MLASTSAWALRKFLRYLVRRQLGRYLEELDAQALEVELSQGTVSLHNLALRGDAISEDLVRSDSSWHPRPRSSLPAH
jgi:hypothetical protein